MQRLTTNEPIPAPYRGGVVALGNFDGFHLGHQAVVARARAIATAEGRPLIVATFDPHPVRYFRPDAEPFRLTTLDQRQRLFASAGADAMLVFGFDAALAAVTAQDFIADWLRDRVGAACIVTGADFTFGAGRSGDATILAERATAAGLRSEAVGPIADADGPISSSRIRDALRAGRPEEAARLLTRPYAIQGVVQHGDKVGRTIGYPTANLDMGKYLRPAYGIYAVRGHLPDGRTLDGVANLGIRPQFTPPKELLEPHFFDFDGDLYGQTIEIDLIAHLRPEAKFDDLPTLIAQMDRDSAKAKTILAST
ncbi:bifunctional riboflavin kinase/FAD synthetase [Sphingomonas prati]|uniref:Riboflavin biosynthesis protein n=1 Tax=Sphingomonas prati TaxID=1843237 RepID=A0A7W9BQZ6_9SPHN|nr:bifunctional riboflavin kinase/FAD synthetase [Sphingomonas prati]MBB5728487.1 riboflavin kinase/FMN adenylyltransferase [Sphingomonas prati]GGE73385.1 riboflavin biosynthesis protein [Sphingomonas prati]